MSRVVAFDLETTGLDVEKDRIIEFCFIILDDDLNPADTHSSLVNPGMPIPQESVAVHGITDDMVADAPPFSHFARRIQSLIKDKVLVAHNHRFDMGFLNAELQRAGMAGVAVNHPCIDTLTIEHFVNSHRLEDTYTRYSGKSLEGAHRSEADTLATVEVLRGQRRVHGDRLPTDLEGLLHKNIDRLRNPDREPREWLDHGRRFYRDGSGVARFAFGKHRDAAVADHPDYLDWIIRSDFPPDTKGVAHRLMQEKPDQPAVPLAPEPATSSASPGPSQSTLGG